MIRLLALLIVVAALGFFFEGDELLLGSPPNTACNFDRECEPKRLSSGQFACANVTWAPGTYLSIKKRLMGSSPGEEIVLPTCRCADYTCAAAPLVGTPG